MTRLPRPSPRRPEWWETDERRARSSAVRDPRPARAPAQHQGPASGYPHRFARRCVPVRHHQPNWTLPSVKAALATRAWRTRARRDVQAGAYSADALMWFGEAASKRAGAACLDSCLRIPSLTARYAGAGGRRAMRRDVRVHYRCSDTPSVRHARAVSSFTCAFVAEADVAPQFGKTSPLVNGRANVTAATARRARRWVRRPRGCGAPVAAPTCRRLLRRHGGHRSRSTCIGAPCRCGGAAWPRLTGGRSHTSMRCASGLTAPRARATTTQADSGLPRRA